MSIIHEALKKVQSDRSENKTFANPKTSAPASPSRTSDDDPVIKPRSKKMTWSVLSLYLWCVLFFVLCGMTFYNLYEMDLWKKKLALAQSSPTAALPAVPRSSNGLLSVPAAATLQNPSPAPKPVQPKKGEILLSGIVLMDGKNFALINNKFYEEGETVEGTTITKITIDSIDISQKGKTRTIKVIRPD